MSKEYLEKYGELLSVSRDVSPGLTYEERLEELKARKPTSHLKGADDCIRELRDPNPKVRMGAAWLIYMLNDFRGLTPMLEALSREEELTAALNIAETALFLGVEAADRGMHKLLEREDLHPNARKGIERILKKWNLL